MINSERLHRLINVLESIRSPNGPLHEQLCAQTTQMAETTMSQGLQLALRHWDRPGLERLCVEETPHLTGAILPRVVGVVLGGVLPPSHIQAIAYPFLLGASVVVKAPAGDALFPKLFVESLGDGVVLVDRAEWDDATDTFDAVVAVGSDESVRAVRETISVDRPVLTFGHRTAIALVDGMDWTAETVASLHTDVAAFDQLGCLSPREIWSVGSLEQAHSLCVALAERFNGLTDRRSLGLPVEAAIRTQRELNVLHGRRVFGPSDLSWGIGLVDGGCWAGTPGGRHVIVRRLPSLDEVAVALAPLQGHVSAASLNGIERRHVSEALIRAGASRIVDVGHLQDAPPHWPHDGRRPLAALCRWCEIE